jgi:peptidoglycan/LPS O-acetylase OafA/YrhL
MPQGVSEAQRHMPELDGIRGLAILGVLCSHGVALAAALAPVSVLQVAVRLVLTPLWGGVDLFFALSGFLITGILLRTRRNSNYFSSFYGRRVLRIFPIYYLVLISTVLAGHFSAHVAAFLPPTLSARATFFLYLQNWPAVWHGGKIVGGIWGIYWSLAVEEQFYLVWPVVVLLLPESAITAVCCFGLAGALPLRLLLASHGDYGLAEFTPSRIDGLLAGAACAVFLYRYRKPLPSPSIVAAAATGVAIMAYIAVFHTAEFGNPGRWMTTVGITAYALLSGALIAASQHPYPALRRALRLGWLRTAGKYSYGMYVYHLLVFLPVRQYLLSRGASIHLSFATALLLVLAEMVVVFLIAKFSYDYFESRVLQLRSYFNPAPARAV